MRANDLEPSDPEGLTLQGEILESLGDLEGAETVFSQAARIDPTPDRRENLNRVQGRLTALRLPPEYRAIPTKDRITRAELASIIVEPLMRGLSSKPGFLEAVRDISSQYQIPLVFDEVCTGFRLALGGAQEYYGITPDLAIFGKGLGSGYPIGAVAGNEEIMSYLDPSSDDPNRIFSLGSFHGNAISTSAGVATIKGLKAPEVYQNLNLYGDNMRSALEEMFLRYDIPVQMSGAGNIVEWFFTSEPITDFKSSLASNWKLKNLLGDEMRKRKIFCGAGRFSSSTVHGKTEYDMTLDSMEESLRSLRDTGNLVP